jgi:ubiquinone/menaquinone biosynthesis C-methylase UbiE
MAKRGRLLYRLEPLFWSLQSLIWDDYLEFPECREEIRAVASWFASFLGPGNLRVLDVGCGTGNYALALAALGYNVVGVDFSIGMLRRARAKAAQLTDADVTFEQADFNRGLPFPAKSFDAVLCVAALQCAAGPVCFLNDIHRVLHPDGWFLLIVLDPAQRSSAKSRLKITLPRIILRQIKTLSNRIRHVHRYNHDELLALLTGAGFELVEERTAAGTIALMNRTVMH